MLTLIKSPETSWISVLFCFVFLFVFQAHMQSAILKNSFTRGGPDRK